MIRLHLAMFVIGIALIFHGYEEMQLSRRATAEPEKVDLAGIEAGKRPENIHLTLGEHYRLYPAAIYTYSRDKGDSSRPGPGTSVNHVFYPVISTDHPFLKAMEEMALKYGKVADAPKDVPRPKLDSFAVIVKTDRLKTVGSIPNDWKKEGAITGLVVNQADPLKDSEIALIRHSFPRFDAAHVLVLEEGRKPSGFLYYGSMFCIGPFLMILPIFLRFGRRS